MRRKDKCADFIDLEWPFENTYSSLDAIYKHVSKGAKKAIKWYGKGRGRKKKWAAISRVLIILFGAVAGIIPILLEISMFQDNSGRPLISPAWASIFVALAGMLMALDKYFGFSRGWVRYITAELRIRHLLEEFQMDWVTQNPTWDKEKPDPERARAMMDKAKAFAAQVNLVTQKETNAWAAEFQTNLKQLDEAVAAKADVSRPGGLNVTVTNGDDCDDGWKLSIDGGIGKNYTGQTAAITDLMPGSHTLKVEGTIAGEPKQAEFAAQVPAGGIGKAELTLS